MNEEEAIHKFFELNFPDRPETVAELDGLMKEVVSEAKKVAVEECKHEIERLSERDGNATIELCFNDGFNPFARRTLKIVNFNSKFLSF